MNTDTNISVQFIAVIGTVTVEIAIVSRYWTRIFTVAWALSYAFTFPFLIIIPLVRFLFAPTAMIQYMIQRLFCNSKLIYYPSDTAFSLLRRAIPSLH